MPGSYGRGNPVIDVHYVDALRTAVVMTLPRVIEAGQLEWILDCSVQVHTALGLADISRGAIYRVDIRDVGQP